MRLLLICGHLRLTPPVPASIMDTTHGQEACYLHGEWVCVACRQPMASRSEHWALQGTKRQCW